MPSGSKVVFVYGPPAVGKLTVASLLAERTGFKLSHNHAIIDAVVPLFDYGTRAFRELVNRFREEIIETAVRERINFVMTYGYVAEEESVVARYVELSGDERRDGAIRATRRHMGDAGAARNAPVAPPARQAADPEPLREMLDRWDFTATVPFEPNLTIDTEEHTPDAAVDEIIGHFGLAQS